MLSDGEALLARRHGAPPRYAAMDSELAMFNQLVTGGVDLVDEHDYNMGILDGHKSGGGHLGTEAAPSHPVGGFAPIDITTCWGAVLRDGDVSCCEKGFTTGKGHFKNKFCSLCRQEGINVPAGRVFVLQEMGSLKNELRQGFWTCAPRVSGYRLINQTAGCQGPQLVILAPHQDPAALDVPLRPIGAEFVDEVGSVRLEVSKGTLIPVQSTPAEPLRSVAASERPKRTHDMLEPQLLREGPVLPEGPLPDDEISAKGWRGDTSPLSLPCSTDGTPLGSSSPDESSDPSHHSFIAGASAVDCGDFHALLRGLSHVRDLTLKIMVQQQPALSPTQHDVMRKNVEEYSHTMESVRQWIADTSPPSPGGRWLSGMEGHQMPWGLGLPPQQVAPAFDPHLMGLSVQPVQPVQHISTSMPLPNPRPAMPFFGVSQRMAPAPAIPTARQDAPHVSAVALPLPIPSPMASVHAMPFSSATVPSAPPSPPELQGASPPDDSQGMMRNGSADRPEAVFPFWFVVLVSAFMLGNQICAQATRSTPASFVTAAAGGFLMLFAILPGSMAVDAKRVTLGRYFACAACAMPLLFLTDDVLWRTIPEMVMRMHTLPSIAPVASLVYFGAGFGMHYTASSPTAACRTITLYSAAQFCRHVNLACATGQLLFPFFGFLLAAVPSLAGFYVSKCHGVTSTNKLLVLAGCSIDLRP